MQFNVMPEVRARETGMLKGLWQAHSGTGLWWVQELQKEPDVIPEPSEHW